MPNSILVNLLAYSLMAFVGMVTGFVIGAVVQKSLERAAKAREWREMGVTKYAPKRICGILGLNANRVSSLVISFTGCEPISIVCVYYLTRQEAADIDEMLSGKTLRWQLVEPEVEEEGNSHVECKGNACNKT